MTAVFKNLIKITTLYAIGAFLLSLLLMLLSFFINGVTALLGAIWIPDDGASTAFLLGLLAIKMVGALLFAVMLWFIFQLAATLIRNIASMVSKNGKVFSSTRQAASSLTKKGVKGSVPNMKNMMAGIKGASPSQLRSLARGANVFGGKRGRAAARGLARMADGKQLLDDIQTTGNTGKILRAEEKANKAAKAAARSLGDNKDKQGTKSLLSGQGKSLAERSANQAVLANRAKNALQSEDYVKGAQDETGTTGDLALDSKLAKWGVLPKDYNNMNQAKQNNLLNIMGDSNRSAEDRQNEIDDIMREDLGNDEAAENDLAKRKKAAAAYGTTLDQHIKNVEAYRAMHPNSSHFIEEDGESVSVNGDDHGLTVGERYRQTHRVTQIAREQYAVAGQSTMSAALNINRTNAEVRDSALMGSIVDDEVVSESRSIGSGIDLAADADNLPVHEDVAALDAKNKGRELTAAVEHQNGMKSDGSEVDDNPNIVRDENGVAVPVQENNEILRAGEVLANKNSTNGNILPATVTEKGQLTDEKIEELTAASAEAYAEGTNAPELANSVDVALGQASFDPSQVETMMAEDAPAAQPVQVAVAQQQPAQEMMDAAVADAMAETPPANIVVAGNKGAATNSGENLDAEIVDAIPVNDSHAAPMNNAVTNPQQATSQSISQENIQAAMQEESSSQASGARETETITEYASGDIAGTPVMQGNVSDGGVHYHYHEGNHSSGGYGSDLFKDEKVKGPHYEDPMARMIGKRDWSDMESKKTFSPADIEGLMGGRKTYNTYNTHTTNDHSDRSKTLNDSHTHSHSHTHFDKGTGGGGGSKGYDPTLDDKMLDDVSRKNAQRQMEEDDARQKSRGTQGMKNKGNSGKL